jgi:fucose 4-O-acetylase-like acetyltransferase
MIPAGHARDKARSRIEWIDVAKGLGIILVVIGHVRLPALDDWVYRFHMPMFFMLSGMVYRPAPAWEFTAKRIRSLLIPYASFIVLVTLVDDLQGMIRHGSLVQIAMFDLRRLPRDLFGGRLLANEYGVMWFITCLFVSMVLYNLIRLRIGSARSKRLGALMFALFVISYAVAPLSLPWDVAEAPMAIVFIWLGELWFTSVGEGPPAAIVTGPVTLLAAVVAVVGYFETLPMDMKLGDLGTPFATALAAAAWSHLILTACRIGVQWRWPRIALVHLGQASIVILFTHRLLTDRLLPDLYPPLLVMASIVLPYLLYLAIRNSGPVIRLLFLGEPLQVRRAARATPALRQEPHR